MRSRGHFELVAGASGAGNCSSDATRSRTASHSFATASICQRIWHISGYARRRGVLSQQREAAKIFEVTFPKAPIPQNAFLLKPSVSQDLPRRRILHNGRGGDAVRPRVTERISHHRPDGFGHDTPVPVMLVQIVTEQGGEVVPIPAPPTEANQSRGASLGDGPPYA